MTTWRISTRECCSSSVQLQYDFLYVQYDHAVLIQVGSLFIVLYSICIYHGDVVDEQTLSFASPALI